MSVDILFGRDTASQARQRWLPLAVSIASWALFFWALVRLFWSFFDAPEAAIAPGAVPVVTTSARSTPMQNLASLTQFHLFGTSTQPANGMPSAPNAPDTQLKLVLIGVAAGRDPKGGVAIIADENNHQRQYQVGQIISGATLDSIYRDRVVLLYQGRLETLKLPRLSDPNTMAGSAAAGAAPANTVSAGSATVGVMVPSLASASELSNGYVSPTAGVTTAGFDAVRAQVLANPMALAEKIQPVLDANGNLSGIKLNSAEPMLEQAGLRADDVIVSVNGQRINSFQQGQQIATSLASANEITVIVRREGREITLPAVRFR
jgi:general secretion pathway protein C